MNELAAKNIVLDARPGFKVDKIVELEKCFVVSVLPPDYKPEYGSFIGGAMRVDKETGRITLYNPMLEEKE